jgi:hypothetical protein
MSYNLRVFKICEQLINNPNEWQIVDNDLGIDVIFILEKCFKTAVYKWGNKYKALLNPSSDFSSFSVKSVTACLENLKEQLMQLQNVDEAQTMKPSTSDVSQINTVITGKINELIVMTTKIFNKLNADELNIKAQNLYWLIKILMESKTNILRIKKHKYFKNINLGQQKLAGFVKNSVKDLDKICQKLGFIFVEERKKFSTGSLYYIEKTAKSKLDFTMANIQNLI